MAAVLAIIRDSMAEDYYGTTYDNLSEDQKNDEDFVYYVQYYYDNDFNDYYGQVVYDALSSDGKKSLADEYLMEYEVKPDYSAEDYAALSEEEKAAKLKEYKDSYYDDMFEEYMDSGESFTDASMTDERKDEVINDYYYKYYITYDSDSDAYYEIANYANVHYSDSLFITDITSDGALDAIYNRDKHIYTSIDVNDNASMTFLGYSQPAYKDFLIYPTTMSNKKTVTFDIDASNVKTHTLEGAGFLINSGIDSSGYIHGYILFYQFNTQTTGNVHLLKIKNGVTAEELHNSSSDRFADYTSYEYNSETDTYEEVTVHSPFVDIVDSQAFTFNSDSLKKKISLSVTPETINCFEKDYASNGTLGDANELFTAAVAYDSELEAYPLTSTGGYNGFGPIASYLSHSCEQLSAFTFSNLKMSYESSSVESLRSATYIDNAKKVYIVLTGGTETGTHDDLNTYNELLARLNKDEIFYLTTGGGYTVADSGGNGLNLAASTDKAADAAEYISKLKTGETIWSTTSLPTGSNLLPVAAFDVTDSSSGSQILSIDQKHIGDSSVTVKFGNINKSVALATGAEALTYAYKVYDPSGNELTLGGTDNNELTINSASDSGSYTFELTVSEGARTSVAATRTFTVANDVTAPEITVNSADNPYTSRSITIDIADGGSGVAAYAVGKATGEDEAVYGSEIVVSPAEAQKDAILSLGSGTYTLYVKAYDECGNERVWSLAVNVAQSSDSDPTPPPPQGTVFVDDKKQDAGEIKNTTVDGQTVKTFTVDSAKLSSILESAGNNTTVVIPVTGSDVAIAGLTGQMIKNMETKDATVEVTTDSATYTLPASEINIDAISKQLGESVTLSDIQVQIEIAQPSADTVKVVENAAAAGEFSIVVPAVNFSISCTYNNKTVDVSSFNAYVERTVAIPDGVDPSKNNDRNRCKCGWHNTPCANKDYCCRRQVLCRNQQPDKQYIYGYI